jgi:putative transposase
MMKYLGERYVPEFNRRHDRTGTLWEGRFRSSAIDSERYLFECQRYIELNPIRAGMVSHPADYEWSSYRVNAEGAISFLVTAHPRYMALGSTEIERRHAYRKLFTLATPSDEILKIRKSINSGAPLGDREFAAVLEKRAGHPVARGIRVRLRTA